MCIVSTSMHDAIPLGSIRKFCLLLDRQCIHVCSQCNHRSWLTALQISDNTMTAYLCSYLQSQLNQLLSNLPSCFRFLQAELWIHVEITSELDQEWLYSVSC